MAIVLIWCYFYLCLIQGPDRVVQSLAHFGSLKLEVKTLQRGREDLKWRFFLRTNFMGDPQAKLTKI